MRPPAALLPAGLLLALVFPAGGQEAAPDGLKFSHRLHLEQAGARCTDCHASAAASTASGDRNLPAEKDCLKCHDGNRASKQCSVCHVDAARARPVALDDRKIRFNHKLHLAMGNIAPLLRAAIDSGKYLAPPGEIRQHLNGDNLCEACHRGLKGAELASRANLPQMADCLVCHNQIEPPFSCEKCHMETSSLKPASHTADYIDLHSSKKIKLDKPSCRICHGVNFRCMGCH